AQGYRRGSSRPTARRASRRRRAHIGTSEGPSMTHMCTMTLAAVALATVAVAAEQAAQKPGVDCQQIVEVYKGNQSVDQASSALKVDQKRIAECLKAAGIATPNENDR